MGERVDDGTGFDDGVCNDAIGANRHAFAQMDLAHKDAIHVNDDEEAGAEGETVMSVIDGDKPDHHDDDDPDDTPPPRGGRPALRVVK